MDIFAQFTLLQQLIALLPDWIHAVTLLVTAAAAIAALTPTQADDTLVASIMKVVDWLALNFGNAGSHNKTLQNSSDEEVS